MQSAFFKDIRRQIITLLNTAQKDIVIAMAWFTSGELFETLLMRLNRGVKVKLILLDNAINWLPIAPDFNLFIENGGEFYVAKEDLGFMHHKFCVIDSEIVITGSYNWTYYAETRNIENVIISREGDIIKLYKDEFSRLLKVFPKKDKAPRLTLEEIEDCESLYRNELNFEIESLAKEKDLSYRSILKSNTLIQIIDTPAISVSHYDIGLQVTGENDKEIFLPFIRRNVDLPFASDTYQLHNDNEHRSNVKCRILLRGAEQSDEDCIVERPITGIIGDRTDENLTIEITMTLDKNGYLHAEVKCVETGKSLDISVIDKKLIKN